MSISSITKDELLRKGKEVPSASRNTMKVDFKKAVETPTSGEDSAKGSIDALVKYIPTETLTLYIATVSALPALVAINDQSKTPIAGFDLYIMLIAAFSILTIVFVILIYAGKYNNSHSDRWWPPTNSSKIPVWSLISATLAFIVWAIAIPNSLYELSSSWGVRSGLIAR
jgi:hypothetical protein